MLDNTPNQPSKFRAKNWVKINYVLWGTYKPLGKLNLKFQG